MEAGTISSQIYSIDDIFNDLTKSQCNNSQVVTAETKYRNTDDHTEQCCNCRTYKDRKDKARNLRDRICSNL